MCSRSVSDFILLWCLPNISSPFPRSLGYLLCKTAQMPWSLFYTTLSKVEFHNFSCCWRSVPLAQWFIFFNLDFAKAVLVGVKLFCSKNRCHFLYRRVLCDLAKIVVYI
uniref:Uncharacterized protein n=1 Tax=Octopus bimaculoides TaxID=37653 RepID=A0A0L8HF14_OCTBM